MVSMDQLSEIAGKTRSVEERFLSGVSNRLADAKGSHLRGSIWKEVTEDDSDALRAMMARRRMYDRQLLGRLPHNRRVELHGFDRSWLFWKKATGRAVASVLSPLEDMLDENRTAAPIGVSQLSEHVSKLAGEKKIPVVIGVCSTTGFTEEARNHRFDQPNVTVVLIEPHDGGGWRISAGKDVPRFVRELFDPEGAEQKIRRVADAVAEHSTDLLTGGVSSDRLAKLLSLPQRLVETAMKQVADRDPELRISGAAGERFLYRGAPVVAKEKPMSFVDRIRELFSSEGDEAAKVNVLSEKRAALAQRRDRIYEDIGKLEEREADLLNQGRENKSQVVRRRLAAQVAQLRRDIARANTTTNMLNQQINIISTDIHNLTLIQQGQMASLPSTEVLTENAVKAEEMLETLQGNAEMVASLEAGVGELTTSSEERDILAEFESDESAAATTPPAKASKSPPARSASSASEADLLNEFDAAPQPPTSQRADTSRRQASDPEAT